MDLIPTRRLITTADDFGLDVAVNEAVEEAHVHGILTSASLMVGAPAAADAVARARRLPHLKVGLHLTLVDGVPTLPPQQVPHLLDGEGRFSRRQAWAGVRYFFHPTVRDELAREMEAQFKAFAATGLVLDHVNAHKHMHIHPTVGGLAIRLARRFGAKGLRFPFEPHRVMACLDAGAAGSGVGEVLLSPWLGLLRTRALAAGLVLADQVFGIAWSGTMTEARVAALLQALPPGLSEIYWHPASRRTPALVEAMPAYHHVEEMQSLMSERVRDAMNAGGISLGSYS